MTNESVMNEDTPDTQDTLSGIRTNVRSVLSDVKTNIQSQLGYFIFLVILLAFLLYYLNLTFGMSQRATRLLPQLAIAFGIVFVLADIIKVAFFNRFSKALNWDETTADRESALVNTILSSEQSIGLSEILPVGLTREVCWIVAYVAGLYYIGFFTGTFLFAFMYIITHQEQLTPMSILKSVLLSSGIIAFLWVLFVHIMGTASIFRLGMFP